MQSPTELLVVEQSAQRFEVSSSIVQLAPPLNAEEVNNVVVRDVPSHFPILDEVTEQF
jgi:hypothetical protein